jgi:membrane protein
MLELLTQSFKNWFSDDPFTNSAAAAYYAIFSFPGLIIIIMSIAALAFDSQQVQSLVSGQLSQILGKDTANSLFKIVEETQREDRDKWALIAGMLTLSFGATGLFANLQRSLNNIFQVEVKKSAGILIFLRTRLISFGIVLILGLLLLVSLSLTALITLFSDWITMQFSTSFTLLIAVITLITSLSIVTSLFTLIYKILPDADIKWRSALMGGVLATILFEIGESTLNFYFGIAKPESTFGAAGSLVLLMLWVSYSCMILFIGAEFCKTYELSKYNRKIIPNKIAENTE